MLPPRIQLLWDLEAYVGAKPPTLGPQSRGISDQGHGMPRQTKFRPSIRSHHYSTSTHGPLGDILPDYRGEEGCQRWEVIGVGDVRDPAPLGGILQGSHASLPSKEAALKFWILTWPVQNSPAQLTGVPRWMCLFYRLPPARAQALPVTIDLANT